MKKTFLFLLAFLMTTSVGCAQGNYSYSSANNEDAEIERLSTNLSRAKKVMNKLMKEIVTAYPDDMSPVKGWGEDVRVDVQDLSKEIVVKADLPGMNKDKIEIVLENNRILKISGVREVAKSETAPNLVKQERSYGKFERVLTLPADCKSDGIKASYKEGVLEIVLEKKEPERGEKVKVEVQ